MKGIFFHRFDKAVHAEPWELKNTLLCQLWQVGRLRVNYLELSSSLAPYYILSLLYLSIFPEVILYI